MHATDLLITYVFSQALTIGIIDSGIPSRSYGQDSYKLTCNVIGIDTGKINIGYQWTKLNASIHTRTNLTNNQELLFPSPLKLSDAGVYVCEVNVSLFGQYVTAVNSYSLYIQS